MTSPKESGAPGTITAGYWLVVTGAVLGVLVAVFVLFNKQPLIDASVKVNKDPNITPEMIAATLNAVLIVALVVTVVVAGLSIWFAGKVRAGLRKPRTGLMITLLINLFFQLLTNTLGVVVALVAIAGLVLFYFRQSSDYLTQREQLT
ncbi:hypothetical protein LFM09_12935 [Lentzea alba]|uniref:hypothetical protein n=1 Tax=Lentzea alba TaxID=2714351 RepID=UPI0039BF3EB3